MAAPILFSFRLPVCNTRPIDRYNIICVSTRNYNNDFILEFILRETKMADFERRQLEIHIQTLIGIQPAEKERRKAKNRQLRDSNPGCLTEAAINCCV